MNNFIGKKLRYKSGPNEIYDVVNQSDGMIVLSNNARVSENKVYELFDEVRNDVIDPNSFFGGSGLNSIANAIRNGQTKAVVGIQDNSDGVVKMQLFDKIPEPIKTQPKSDSNLHGLEDTDTTVRKVYGDSMKEYVNEDEFNQYNSNKSIRRPVETVSPITSQFKNLKKSTPIKIRLDIDEKIPKIDSIRHLNDLFEDSIIDYLAKEITDKYLNNPELLEKLIKEKLESVVYPNKRKKAKKKPVRAKKTTTVSKDDKNINVE